MALDVSIIPRILEILDYRVFLFSSMLMSRGRRGRGVAGGRGGTPGERLQGLCLCCAGFFIRCTKLRKQDDKKLGLDENRRPRPGPPALPGIPVPGPRRHLQIMEKLKYPHPMFFKIHPPRRPGKKLKNNKSEIQLARLTSKRHADRLTKYSCADGAPSRT